MKTYDKIIHELYLSELANTHMMPISDVEDYVNKRYIVYSIELQRQASKLYAQQVAEDVRKRCAENAECFVPWEGQDAVIAESSILETKIILP